MDLNQLPSATPPIVAHLKAEGSIIDSYGLDRRQRCTDPVSSGWFLTLVTKDFVPSLIPMLQQGREIFDPAANHEAVELILRTFDALFNDAKAGQVGSDLRQGRDIPVRGQEPYPQTGTRGRRLHHGRAWPFQRMPAGIQTRRGQCYAQRQATRTVNGRLQGELASHRLH